MTAHDADADIRQQAAVLWHRYWELTLEMKKFIDREDVDEFMALVAQRGSLIAAMKALPENDYARTEAGRQLVERIAPIDRQVLYKARTWLNRSKQRNATVKSYDLASTRPAEGIIFNKRY
jgi:hypothetical protein